MNKVSQDDKRLLRRIIAIIVLAFILFFVGLLKHNRDFSEWWTRYIARGYSFVFTYINKYIPFSLTELFYLIIIALIIFFIVKSIIAIKKEERKVYTKYILNIILTITSIVTVYNLSCEFAYNRKKVDLPFYNQQVDNKEFKDLYNYFASDLNECLSQMEFKDSGEIIYPYSFEETSKLVEEEYKKITSSYYYSHTGRCKRMMTSFIYREMRIVGITFAPFSEANVNYLETEESLALTMAHELAHAKGVMREDDANQVAFYLCLNSENIYLRYSAYFSYFSQIKMLRSKDYVSEEELKEFINIDTKYHKNKNYVYDYWMSHSHLYDIGDFFNDLYIKMSGVKEGSQSYSGGSSSDYSKEKRKLSPSKYQQLFLEKYYRLKDK